MAKKKRIAVLDAETDPFLFGRLPEPFLWGFYDGNTYTEFTSTAGIVEFISHFDGIIYAHNGGKFDFHFFLDAINPLSPIKVINGRLAECHVGNATLRDSMNILPVALSAFQKDEIDYSKFEKAVRHKHMAEISAYLENDCKYLYAAVSEFIKDYGLNLTLAGGAVKFWAKKFNNNIPRTNEDFYNFIKPYYYGGRVTPFKTGVFHGNFKIYDIKSAYPYAMLSEHPFGNRYFETTRVLDHELPRCFLRVRARSNGAFPARASDNSVGFPSGSGIFHITGWEFIAALETNTAKIEKIENIICFENKINFKEYIEHFYKLKLHSEQVGDNTRRTFAKLFMNSLYGKFAANPDNYEEYILGEFGDAPPDNFSPDSIVGDRQLFSRPLPDDKRFYLNVAISASITGFVRAYLWRNIQKVKVPYYCDTDSIICENGDLLDVGENLGQWELEGEFQKLAIAGKKLYAASRTVGKSKTACKGVRISAREIEIVANGGSIKYESDAPTYSLKTGAKFSTRTVRNTCGMGKDFLGIREDKEIS